MSHLSLPRIHFQGDFIANVGTANNDNRIEMPAVDGLQVSIYPLLDAVRNISDEQLPKRDEELRKRMEGHGQHPVLASWNYYGDNDCYFDNAVVTSVELSSVEPELAKKDAVVGARVSLLDAVMVDVNSEGIFGVQIFADIFQLLGDGMFFKGEPSVAYSRWLNFRRNSETKVREARGGAIFQTSLDKGKLSFNPGKSKALEAFQIALSEPEAKGLCVRMCVYFVRPVVTEQELGAHFSRNSRIENPGIGRVIGTIGIWKKGELASVSMGRLLTAKPKSTTPFFPAVAFIDNYRKVISLDLINTFPEKNEALDKDDQWGEVTLNLLVDETTREIGKVSYDKKAYEATAGVIDVAYEEQIAEELERGRLVLYSPEAGCFLVENEYMVDSDDRCIYMEVGEQRQVQLDILRLGRAIEQPVSIDVAFETEADTWLRLAGNNVSAEDALKKGITKDVPAYQVVLYPIVKGLNLTLTPDGRQQMVIQPGNKALLTLEALRPGSARVSFMPNEPSPRQPDVWVDFYINVRVLPNDSYCDKAPVTFESVYKEVLRYYHILHPAMSRVFDLSVCENWDSRRAKMVLERTDPDLFYRYSYMPRTRDMSNGKRRLLHRWCKSIIDKG